MGISTGYEPEPVFHRGKAYPANLSLTMPYSREADGQWEEVGGAQMRGDLAYEFDEVIVFRHKFFGGLIIAHDSGCSCPTPFEDMTVKDGRFLNRLVDFDEFTEEHRDKDSGYAVDSIAALRKVIEPLIDAQPTYVEEAPAGLIDGPSLAGQQTFIEP